MERLTIVNTGLLPSQFRATQGRFKDFVASGQRITLTGRLQPDGQVAVSQFVSFHWIGWTIVAVVIASPLLLFLIQLPKQRKLAVHHAGPSLAERLAAEYPEEVLAAAFARVSGSSAPAPSSAPVGQVAPSCSATGTQRRRRVVRGGVGIGSPGVGRRSSRFRRIGAIGAQRFRRRRDGKTLLAARIIDSGIALGKRSAFVVPNISLIDQTIEALEAEGIDHIGVMQADHPRTDPTAPSPDR